VGVKARNVVSTDSCSDRTLVERAEVPMIVPEIDSVEQIDGMWPSPGFRRASSVTDSLRAEADLYRYAMRIDIGDVG
jgi:hypothetical protein